MKKYYCEKLYHLLLELYFDKKTERGSRSVFAFISLFSVRE